MKTTFLYSFGASIYKIDPFTNNILGVNDEFKSWAQNLPKDQTDQVKEKYLEYCEKVTPEILQYDFLLILLEQELGSTEGLILSLDPKSFKIKIVGVQDTLLKPLRESLSNKYYYNTEVVDKSLIIQNTLPSFYDFLKLLGL